MFFHRVRIAAGLTGALLAGLTLPGAVVAAGQGERPVHVFVLGAPAPAADLAAALSRILPAPHEQRREREPVCGRSLPCAFDTSRAASARRTYALHVARRHEDVVKAIVAGAVPVHGTILAASASADLAPRAREQLALALRAGLPGLVVYLTSPDAEDGQGARAAWPRLRALLDEHGLAGNATPVIRGSALQALEGDTSEQGEGSIELPEGVEMVMPGDNVQMTAKLVTPLAMEEGSRFAVREGGRTVGAGIVSRIVE